MVSVAQVGIRQTNRQIKKSPLKVTKSLKGIDTFLNWLSRRYLSRIVILPDRQFDELLCFFLFYLTCRTTMKVSIVTTFIPRAGFYK